MKKTIMQKLTFLGLSVLLIFSSCGPNSGTVHQEGTVVTTDSQTTNSYQKETIPVVNKQEEKDNVTNTSEPSSTQNDSPKKEVKSLTFKLTQDVQFGNYIIKINSGVFFKSDNEFWGADQGNVLYAIDVEYKNTTVDQQFSSNPFHWTLFDVNGYSYSCAIMVAGKKPKLETTTINPGGKVRGWVTFEIPNTATPYKVQFKPSLTDYSNVEIIL